MYGIIKENPRLAMMANKYLLPTRINPILSTEKQENRLIDIVYYIYYPF